MALVSLSDLRHLSTSSFWKASSPVSHSPGSFSLVHRHVHFIWHFSQHINYSKLEISFHTKFKIHSPFTCCRLKLNFASCELLQIPRLFTAEKTLFPFLIAIKKYPYKLIQQVFKDYNVYYIFPLFSMLSFTIPICRYYFIIFNSYFPVSIPAYKHTVLL